jgi:CRISPR/Cas system endoribonuclease Cas6 (RAMP superfamily)
MSPTMIRNRDFIYVLPVPEKFLVNPIMKIKNICQIFTKKDIEKYKHFLREYVLVNQFKIKTEKIVIKKSERAGVVGNVRYVVKNLEDNENNKLLNITLKLIKFL